MERFGFNQQGPSLSRQSRHDNGGLRQLRQNKIGAFRGQVGALGECQLFIGRALYALSEVQSYPSTFENKTGLRLSFHSW